MVSLSTIMVFGEVVKNLLCYGTVLVVVSSCDNFKNTKFWIYVGSFISMSQVDNYYENVERNRKHN